MTARKNPARKPLLSLERLEDRWALAGNVVVTNPGSDLKLTGDNAENDISIVVAVINNVPNWRITGNNGTQITFGGNTGAQADVPVPAGFFRKVTIDMKQALTSVADARGPAGSGGADFVEMDGLIMRGDLKISGGNGGVVDLNLMTVRGKTTIDFDKANGLSSVVGSEAIGCEISIRDSQLGINLPQGNKPPPRKDVIITTKDFADEVFLANVDIGKNLTIKTAGSQDCVGLEDVNMSGNLSIDAGHKEKGPAADFVAASGVFVGGTTSVKTGAGDDIVAIGATAGLNANTLLKTVTIDTGAGNDLVAAQDTTFGGTVSAKTQAGDDTVRIADNIFNHPQGALKALSSTNGGLGTDTLLNDLAIAVATNGFEVFAGNIAQLDARIQAAIDACFGIVVA